MAYFLNGLAFAIGVSQLGTVVFLAIRAERRYAFVFGYCLAQLGTTVAELAMDYAFGPQSKQYRVVFWSDELVLDLLLFLILTLLTHRALESSAVKSPLSRVLVAVLVLPFVLYKGAFVLPSKLESNWFDHTSQLLNFGAAILNLGLWTALLGSRKRDPQVLLVSAGFGVLATGEAVSYGLRRLFPPHSTAYTGAGLLFVLANLAGAAILCWAFRPTRGDRPRLVLSEQL